MAAPYQNYTGGTFLGDLVTRPEFLGYVQEDIYNQCKFVQSGALVRNSALDAKAGGVKVQVPFFKPIAPTEERITSANNWGTSGAGYLTPQKIEATDQIMPIIHRGFSYAVDDLSRLGTGSDPMAAIRSQISQAINKLRTATMLNQLDGIFGAVTGNATDASSNAASTEANYLSISNVIKAKNLLGERSSELSVIAMHSDVYAYLQQAGSLQFSSTALAASGAIQWGGGGIGQTQTEVAFFNGLRVIQADLCAPTLNAGGSDQYPVYILGAGALNEGVQQELKIESDRNILSKQDVISLDYHYGFHLGGTKYSGADNPTNANLSTAGNWALAYTERKMVNAVKVTVNTPFSVNKA